MKSPKIEYQYNEKQTQEKSSLSKKNKVKERDDFFYCLVSCGHVVYPFCYNNSNTLTKSDIQYELQSLPKIGNFEYSLKRLPFVHLRDDVSFFPISSSLAYSLPLHPLTLYNPLKSEFSKESSKNESKLEQGSQFQIAGYSVSGTKSLDFVKENIINGKIISKYHPIFKFCNLIVTYTSNSFLIWSGTPTTYGSSGSPILTPTTTLISPTSSLGNTEVIGVCTAKFIIPRYGIGIKSTQISQHLEIVQKREQILYSHPKSKELSRLGSFLSLESNLMNECNQ